MFVVKKEDVMQIVICDDLKEERDLLKEHIHAYGQSEGLDYTIEEYVNAECLLSAIRGANVHPNIIFMDIYMEGMTGMDAAKLILAEGFRGAMIFTTTSVAHSIESYKIMADGYLLKPFSRAEFNMNFERAVQNYKKSYKTISFPCDRLEFRVFIKDLEYVEAIDRSCFIYVKKERLRTTKTISEFAKELLQEECFLQCHRSCIVNLNFVEKVESRHVLMKSGERVALAVQNRQSFRKAVSDYFFLKMREN